MKLSRALTLALVAATVMQLTVASADHTPGTDGCPVHVTETSASKPNATDNTNDWEGLILGNGSATIPAGDVYREGTDITAAWLHRDEAGQLTANVSVVNLSAAQANAFFYVLWDYATDSEASRRFVSARLKGYAVAYTYGYLTTNPVTGGNLFKTEGETTGSLVEGPDGQIVINVPSSGTSSSGRPVADWGAPTVGSTLSNVQAESRILIGSPEALPSNPTGFRHGYVYEADNTDDGPLLCDAYVNA